MKVKKSPYDEIFEMFQLIEKCCIICGVNIYAPTLKLNIITFLMLLSTSSFFIFVFYTIWLKFDEDWRIIFEAGCLLGVAIQGLSKLIVGITNKENIKWARDEVFHIYKFYQNVNAEFRKILEKGTARIKSIIILITIAWAVIAISFCFIPLYYKIFFHKRILVIPFYIPKLDPDTDVGYFSLCLIQTLCVIFGVIGNTAGDAFVILHFLILCIYSDITKQKIIEFNEFLNKDSSAEKEIRLKFKDIAKFLQEYSSYSDLLINEVYIVVNCEIVCAAYGAIFSVYVTLEGNWPASTFFFVISMMQLYIYGMLGTIVGIAAENALGAIYEIEWYQLDIRHQKLIKFMILKYQKPTLFAVFGLQELSVNMALQVTKTVYSFVMMLISFQK